MLNQLLALKQRREMRIRQRIAQCDQEIRQLQQQQQQSIQQQVELWEAWRQANAQQQQVPEGKLYRVQQHLSDFYQRDQGIKQQQKALQQALEQVTAERLQHKQGLQRNRVEQEKLTYVLEESS
jgi:hypothetical protein